MRKVTVRGLSARKLRLALTALAIVLGVTFISGMFVLTDTLNSMFSVLIGNVYSKLAAFTLPAAQQLLRQSGQLAATAVVTSPGADKHMVQQDIEAVLPRGIQVVTGQTVQHEASSSISQALRAFSTALLVFAFISLFVGAFTIVNTFSITVGQRTRDRRTPSTEARSGYAGERKRSPGPRRGTWPLP